MSGILIWVVVVGVSVFLSVEIHAVSCVCGLVPQQREFISTTTGLPLDSVCFGLNIDPTPYCSKIRVRLDNTAAIPNMCFNTFVGSRSLACQGWFQFPDLDGISLDVYICAMFDRRGNPVVSFAECQPGQTQMGVVFDFLPVQPEFPDPLWSSSSRCRDSLCPEAPAAPDFTNPYLTNRTGESFSICNRVINSVNVCNSVTGTCQCQVFNDGSEAFTGEACQFEKGQGTCCAAPASERQAPCCDANTPLGQCVTSTNLNMCGVLGQSRSPNCISPDGISPPSCQELVYNPIGMNFTLVSKCSNGYACPNDTVLLQFKPNSVCLTNPDIRREPCACQCELCTEDCSGSNNIGPAFGQCGYHPPHPPSCECFIPPAPCVNDPSVPNSCTINPLCRAGDLCGGTSCNINLNNCHTQTLCDSSQLWSIDVPHPCVCSGNGLCNTTSRACDCFNLFGNLDPADGPPIFSAGTRCANLDSCHHCNLNTKLTTISPSICISNPNQPEAFQCNCSRYWYTSGSFQNTDNLIPGTPVFQCSIGTCVGYFSVRPNVTTVAMTLPYEQMKILPGVKQPVCACPPFTIPYPYLNREYCIVEPPISPVTNMYCGHGDFDFIQILAVPPMTLLSNVQDPVLQVTNLADLGGQPPQCTCEGFFNETWEQGSWYTVTGPDGNKNITTNTSYCAPWCFPLNVTFFLRETPPSTVQRTCVDCASFGFATVTNAKGETQCGGSICMNGGVWDQRLGRCNCVLFPYDVNFPNDTICNVSSCFPFSFNPISFQCNCPNSLIFTTRLPPAGCGPSDPSAPECIDGPTPILGCKSNCANGGKPMPPLYNSCNCTSSFFKPPLCNETVCPTTQGMVVLTPQPHCECYPTWTGDDCQFSECNPLYCDNPMDDPLRTRCNRNQLDPPNQYCICQSATMAPTHPFVSTNNSCSPSFCFFYQVSPEAPTVAQLPLVPSFAYKKNNPVEVVTLLPSGFLPVKPNAAQWSCQCQAGYQARTTAVRPLNPPLVLNDPVNLDLCNQRMCAADQDVIYTSTSLVPDPFQFDPASVRCRCRCPTDLFFNGPYPFPTDGSSPIVPPLAGCPSANPFANPFQQSSFNNPCPGFLINQTDHLNWTSQCLSDLTGINCTQTLCTGNQQFTGNTVCGCRNSWTPVPYCNVCPLLPNNPFTNYTDCSCLNPANFKPVNNNCTFVPCDPNSDPTCFPPPITVATTNPPLGSTEGDDSWLFWLGISIAVAAVLAGIIAGIVIGVQTCRQNRIEEREKQKQQLEQESTSLVPTESTVASSSSLASVEGLTLEGVDSSLMTSSTSSSLATPSSSLETERLVTPDTNTSLSDSILIPTSGSSFSRSRSKRKSFAPRS